MSQSAIWDALLIAGDALQDGRLEDCEGVLVELDAMDAWSFIVKPRYDYTRGQSLVEWKLERILAGDWVPLTPMDDCYVAVDLGGRALRDMQLRADDAPIAMIRRLTRWFAQAQGLLSLTVRRGSDAIEVRVRSWANLIEYPAHAWVVV